MSTNAKTKKVRNAPLNSWLAKHSAHCMWKTSLASATLECWAFPRAAKPLAPLAIVMRYDSGGWDVFTQTTSSNGIAETIAAIEAHLGLGV